MNLPHLFRPMHAAGPQHHYTFILIATDLDPKALPPGLTRRDCRRRSTGHVKGSTGIIATVQKPARKPASEACMTGGA